MDTIVVTGATGNVGRELVRRLTDKQVPVTAVARRITDADVPPGARAIPADLAEPESLRGALQGTDALFLLVAGEAPEEVLAVAKIAGVRKVVLLSSQGAGTRPELFSQARSFEAAVRESELEWSVLRSGGIDSNALAWADSIRTQRAVAAPFGDVGLPFVDPVDVADVAAAVLLGVVHSGKTYTLTGPRPTTPRERTAALAVALNEPVAFSEQSRTEAHELMAQFMPLPIVEATLAILGEPTEEEQRARPDVENVLGRAASDFDVWARRNVATFR